MRGRVDAVWHARPLHVVACSFEVAWVATRLAWYVELGLPLIARLRFGGAIFLGVGPDEVAVGSACYVAHAATEAYSVGCHHRVFVFRHVAQHHLTLCSLVKGEGSEINPCTAAHLLVDRKLGLAVFVVDGVVCVGGTVGQCLVRHIHRIFAVDRHVGSPGDGALLAFLAYRVCHTERAFGKRILKVFIFGTQIGKARALTLCPRLVAVGLGVERTVCGHGAVGLTNGHVGIVVDHHLIRVSVAFARCHDYGAGVLKHRYDVGQHVALRVFVLHALEHTSTLPLPTGESLLVVESVALPHGYMLAVKTV